MKLLGLCLAALLSLVSLSEAGSRTVSRTSARSVSVVGVVREVPVPDVVTISTTRRSAVRSSCVSGECSQRVFTKKVRRGPAVLYRAR